MTRFAQEYAQALYALARDEHLEETLETQLREICALLDAEKDYLRLLDARSVDTNERKQIVDAAFGEQAHSYIVRFMKLLIDRGGVTYFPECAAAYKEMFDADFGVEQATATSAAPLSAEQAEALRKKLEALTGRRVELRCAVDPALIGGVRVDVAGKRYDNTVRSRLDAMRAHLTVNE